MDALFERNKGESIATETDLGLVSVIMPNYNSSLYIGQAVSSVVAQTYQNWELIIVDDCSTDDWVTVLEPFDDQRLPERVVANSGGANGLLPEKVQPGQPGRLVSVG